MKAPMLYCKKAGSPAEHSVNAVMALLAGGERQRKFLSALLLLATLAGCAGNREAPAPPLPAGCETLYTFAPGNYIVDIAGGEDVIIDPGVQDFRLFCSPAEAKGALEKELDEGRIEAGDWRIYRVEGDPEQIAVHDSNGNFLLNRMAALVDWQ